MLLPFRDELLADAHLALLRKAEFFPGLRVRDREDQVHPIAEAIPDIRGKLLLIGESGLGKSTYLRVLAGRSRRTIAYLNARSCDKGVEAAIVQRVSNFESPEFFGGLIYSGDLAVIIDGLNEVSADVRAGIIAFANGAGRANLLIATQPIEGLGGDRSPLTLATPYELLPLAREDIAKFLKSRPARDNPESVVKGEDYDRAVDELLAKALDCAPDGEAEREAEAVLQERRAAELILSNPMDLTYGSELIAFGQTPQPSQMIGQAFRLARDEYRKTYDRDFPTLDFARKVNSSHSRHRSAKSEPGFSDSSENRRGETGVLEAGENIPEAALQRIARQNNAGPRIVEGEHGHVAGGARQNLRRLARIQRDPEVWRAVRRDAPVLLGEKVEKVGTRRAHATFKFANAELGHIVLGLDAFADQSPGLGRRGNELRQRSGSDAARERSQADLVEKYGKLCRNGSRPCGLKKWIFECAMGWHEPVLDRPFDAGGRLQPHGVPTVGFDIDIFLGDDIGAEPLRALPVGQFLGDQNPARQRAARSKTEGARQQKSAVRRGRSRPGKCRCPNRDRARPEHFAPGVEGRASMNQIIGRTAYGETPARRSVRAGDLFHHFEKVSPARAQAALRFRRHGGEQICIQKGRRDFVGQTPEALGIQRLAAYQPAEGSRSFERFVRRRGHTPLHVQTAYNGCDFPRRLLGLARNLPYSGNCGNAESRRRQAPADVRLDPRSAASRPSEMTTPAFA